MITHLPLDLVSLVAYELRDDPWCLSRFCQTSSEIYQAVIPIMYGDVNLPTCKSIELFCRTINRPTYGFGDYTRVLKVADYTEFSRGNFTPNLAKEFCVTLGLLPNLQDLLLGVGFAQFDLCFHDLKAPFTLRKLRVRAILSKTFRSFIAGQGSIIELHLSRGNISDERDIQEFFHTRPDILPQLRSISAHFPMLPSVVFGRPVTEVVLISEGPGYSWPAADESSWKAIYCTSAASITSVGYYLRHESNAVDPWDQMIMALRANKVHMYLRRFKIEEVFGVSANTRIPLVL